jgi:deoxyribodipyrimidine photo-lyase
MTGTGKINIFWFRRDLRLEDNTALNQALRQGLPVMPLFIFDTDITDDLHTDDQRLTFIYDTLRDINNRLSERSCSIFIMKGDPLSAWKKLIGLYEIETVFLNRDYEPYAISRDRKIEELLNENGIRLVSLKDQVIFESSEIRKSNGSPFTVFTPYRNSWIKKFNTELSNRPLPGENLPPGFLQKVFPMPELDDLGFTRSRIRIKPYDLSCIPDYDKYRNNPAADRTTHLGPHLRFGTISIRKVVYEAARTNSVFLDQLIWREFFMQILHLFPSVITNNFRKKYDNIHWRNDKNEFKKWCDGETGYPFVDAGIRQMNETGYMHNRVRMVVASFLCKHLLTDWRLGEAYFAEKLNDYELASNNGNWQWAAGTGCDAAPYFRIFNPSLQQKKFDPQSEYIRRWIGDPNRSSYPKPVVDHEFAIKRATEVYRSGLIS